MKQLKHLAFLAGLLVFAMPVFGQLAPEISPFLKNLTREQKLQLLELIRQQKAENLDLEISRLYNQLDDTGKKAALESTIKTLHASGKPIRTRVSLPKDSIDFGLVMRGDIVRDSIIIKNDGDQPYIITETVSNCGCAVADKPEFPVPPGESAVIHVEFDTRNILPGPFHRAISIRDNSSPNQRNLVYIVATVKPKS